MRGSTALTAAGAVGLVRIGLDRLLACGLKCDHDPVAPHLGIHGEH